MNAARQRALARIRETLAEMPYGGSADFDLRGLTSSGNGGDVTSVFGKIADALEALRDVLTSVELRQIRERKELEDLRAILASLRSLAKLVSPRPNDPL